MLQEIAPRPQADLYQGLGKPCSRSALWKGGCSCHSPAPDQPQPVSLEWWHRHLLPPKVKGNAGSGRSKAHGGSSVRSYILIPSTQTGHQGSRHKFLHHTADSACYNTNCVRTATTTTLPENTQRPNLPPTAATAPFVSCGCPGDGTSHTLAICTLSHAPAAVYTWAAQGVSSTVHNPLPISISSFNGSDV